MTLKCVQFEVIFSGFICGFFRWYESTPLNVLWILFFFSNENMYKTHAYLIYVFFLCYSTACTDIESYATRDVGCLCVCVANQLNLDTTPTVCRRSCRCKRTLCHRIVVVVDDFSLTQCVLFCRFFFFFMCFFSLFFFFPHIFFFWLA